MFAYSRRPPHIAAVSLWRSCRRDRRETAEELRRPARKKKWASQQYRKAMRSDQVESKPPVETPPTDCLNISPPVAVSEGNHLRRAIQGAATENTVFSRGRPWMQNALIAIGVLLPLNEDEYERKLIFPVPGKSWKELYIAALLEKNRNELPERIAEAEKEIIARAHQLFDSKIGS